MKNSVYIGGDLSYTGSGIAVIRDGQLIDKVCYRSKLTGDRRLQEIVDYVTGVAVAYKPSAWCVEAPAYHHAFNSAILGELHGAFRLRRVQQGLPKPWYVSPSTLKKFATGKGAGDKSNVKMFVLQKWGLVLEDDNICDAYVLARMAEAIHGGASMLAYEAECVKSVKLGVLNKEVLSGA